MSHSHDNEVTVHEKENKMNLLINHKLQLSYSYVSMVRFTERYLEG